MSLYKNENPLECWGHVIQLRKSNMPKQTTVTTTKTSGWNRD